MTHKELMQALVEGKTLKDSGGNTTQLANDDYLIFNGSKVHGLDFSSYSWGIEKPWYETRLPGRVLCWVGDEDLSVNLKEMAHVVVQYESKTDYPFLDCFGNCWKYATPVTPADLESTITFDEKDFRDALRSRSKFYCEVTPKQSETLQKIAFEEGYTWLDGSNNVSDLDKECLEFNNERINRFGYCSQEFESDLLSFFYKVSLTT